ncbi:MULTISPECIES: hypothetical protein [unclassified Thiomonas]|uniref:hypothetical protein n=1 Tax=unclassified Thiomonas TaxID=2625466 RepID=UPI0004DB98C9|nr:MULTISPECIES: hypothetical protein [unclassified Thiomonas]VDY07294.1 protein of unknown function [Thiomonas sp. Sup16B3]CDW92757.1 conserved hypothetical protein [Thiomonas sp. CB2]VDY05542.1 protein of unknown function [Thiomonas sp. Bio17B3]VDY13796.1 conserved protein of unknown function [Thiomonas sp. OC7]VDY17004.1 conserved protein of unknown function [Thiomonas sp. CB2]
MSALQINGQKRLSALLLIGAAALVGLLAYEAQQGIALRDSVLALKTRSSATPPALKLEPPFQLQTLSSYSPITEQPLFVASRTPAKQEATATAAPPQQFELTGIAQTSKESVVLLRDAKTGKTERLKTGEKTKDGLALDSAKPNSATIDQSGQKVTLDLQVVLSGNRPMTPAPPVAAASVPRPGSAPSAAHPPQKGASAPENSKSKSASPAIDPGLQQLNEQRAKMGLPPCRSDGFCPK